MNKQVKNIVIFLGVFCLALECAARLDSYISPMVKPSFSIIQTRGAYGIRGVKYGKWREVKLNKYGFNDSDDYGMDKKTHALRLLCLGDSVAFGALTDFTCNWPNFLEEMLKSKGIDAEVINTSIPGNSYSSIIKQFENEYIEFKPEIVIIYKDYRNYMAPPQDKKHTWLEKILVKSAFYRKYQNKEPQGPYKRLLHRRKRKGIKKLVKNITEKQLSQYRKDLEHLIQICKKNNITLILSPYPTLINETNKDKFINELYKSLYWFPSVSEGAYIRGVSMFNAVTCELAIRENIPYVDITKGLECNKTYFDDYNHLTKRGSEQVAKNYAEALMALPQFYKLTYKIK